MGGTEEVYDWGQWVRRGVVMSSGWSLSKGEAWRYGAWPEAVGGFTEGWGRGLGRIGVKKGMGLGQEAVDVVQTGLGQLGWSWH